MLKNFDLRWYPDAALTVVMAAKGYPGDYAKGTVIEGLDAAAQVEGVEIFHAGTKADGGTILANGGRVLNVCARGRTVREAQARAYAAVDKIHWPDGFCRRDIGWRAVEREKYLRIDARADMPAPTLAMHPVLRGSVWQRPPCIPCCGFTKTSSRRRDDRIPAAAAAALHLRGAWLGADRRQDRERRRSLAGRRRGAGEARHRAA